LGPTSKDNIVEEIIRVVIVRCVGIPFHGSTCFRIN
jgi:hypothetical protein